MRRSLSFAVFISLMLAVTGGVHYYLWARLVRDATLSPGLHRALSALFVALWLSLPLGRLLGARAGRPLSLALAAWPGVMFLLFMALLASDVGRGAWSLAQRWFAAPAVTDPERRTALARLVAAGASLLVGGLSVAALRSGLARVAVKPISVALGRWPAALDGFRIVQLTDLHVGGTTTRPFVEDIVARTNALDADLIVITGDLVDGSVARLRDDVAPLAQLRARHGVFFVTGNHEYYSGAPDWCAALERLGVRVLRNERVSIGDQRASFDLAGIDDWSAARFGAGHGADLPRALAGRDDSRELVLLAHQPKAITEAEQLGVGLQLSGHTHGGQLWPWGHFVRLDQPVVAGLRRIGRAWIYVSNGTGYWGPPMRLAAPAEITELTLRRTH